MRLLIKKILREETSESPLTKQEIALFKFMNKVMEGNPRKDKLFDQLKQGVRMYGLDPKSSQYYFDLFNLNYRPDGRYEKITPDEFKGVKSFKAKTITNPKSGEYTRVKAPFKGSNLKGVWEKDSNREEIYVVYSYGWYPVYLYKKGIWYKILDRYSSSTSKHISHSNPFKYDNKLEKMVVLVDRDEMEKLKYNYGFDEIMKRKKEKILKDKNRLVSKKPQLIRNLDWMETPPVQYKVKFRLTDINEVDDKVVVSVVIDDVVKREGNKSIKSDENYTKGEMENVTKEKVENTVKRDILGNMTQYLGSSKIELPIEFEFTHTLENE